MVWPLEVAAGWAPNKLEAGAGAVVVGAVEAEVAVADEEGCPKLPNKLGVVLGAVVVVLPAPLAAWPKRLSV